MSDDDFKDRLARIQARAAEERAAEGPAKAEDPYDLSDFKKDKSSKGFRKERYGELHDTYRGAKAANRWGIGLGAVSTGAVMAGLSAARDDGAGPDDVDVILRMVEMAEDPNGPEAALFAIGVPLLCLAFTPILLLVGRFLYKWRWAAVWLYFLGAVLAIVAVGWLGPLAFIFI
ncbi:hypothetical protein ACQ5SO_05265 [Rhodovulum sp. DZ06]|uniref:hypothetical protein n=1 Tax=Rhodovulum sp. DZ06 TaxID=3425126 RepID=UPI003D326880